MSEAVIPKRYFFVWFGDTFPFEHYLALKSVELRCRPERIELCTSTSLARQPHFQRLQREVASLRVSEIDAAGWIEQTGLARGTEILQAYRYLLDNRFYAALSDLLRYLLLYLYGGVYMDLDVLVVRDLQPLLGQGGFCGRERILVPGRLQHSRWRYLRTVPLTVLRALLARFDRGVRAFGRVRALYVEAINGAVLGLEQGHPLARDALERLPELARQVPRRRPIVGPDLLQDLLEDSAYPDVTIYPPETFYPLGPTMARHYVRPTANPVALRADVVSEQTHVLHWYNDSNTARALPADETALRALAPRQLFSHLALDLLD